jgi:lipid A ethanolaminephosphotransferase
MFSFQTSEQAAPSWSKFSLAAVVALWLSTVANVSLWQQLWALPEVNGARGLGFVVAFGLAIGSIVFGLLALVAWPWLFKLVSVTLLLTAASSTYFMMSYGIVIDASMLTNVLQTDAREASDLMSWRFALTMLGLGVLPALWVLTRRTRQRPWLSSLWRNLAVCVAGFVVAGLLAVLVFQDLASVMRNHKQLRYLINPLNSVYASVRVGLNAMPHKQLPLQLVGTDAQLGATYKPGAKPLLMVFVVGETGRAASWQLGGYARATTPELAALKQAGELQYYSNVMSCGTNTATSLPCMFSAMGRGDFENADGPAEGLLDVLQRAGLAVLWIDNQSGCKGACDRVPNVNTRSGEHPELCANGECLDMYMLADLDQRIAALPAQQRERGVVLVMHQMGSHGPAYYKRSPEALKDFTPECTSNALQSCDHQALLNAYDNSIRYTDHFVAQTIDWLKARSDANDSALWYVSDHGESLGEKGIYLHGLPYSFAPIEQKHVPQVTWLSPSFQQRVGLNKACLDAQQSGAWTHDHLFHSLLGLADVRTSAYQASLDITATCRANAAP